MVKPTPSKNSPVFLLIGDEKYLKEKTINELRSSLLDSASGELDYKLLHGGDTSADEILASASTIPFFSSKRLVVVKDFEELPKEDMGRLVAYIKKPIQYTCLVIDTKDGALLKNNPSLGKYARILKFHKPIGTELSSWIARYVSLNRKAIDEDAIEILKELQGQDLLTLSQELEKLIAFAGDKKKISRPDVENLIGKSMMASVFDIARAVASKDISGALDIVNGLVSSGKRPHEIIGIIAWHFKMILKIKALLSKGEEENYVSEILRISRKNEREFFTEAAAWSLEQVASKLELLLEADLNLKRAQYSPSLILEFAVIRLCL